MDIESISRLAYVKMGDSRAHSHREKGFVYYHGLRVAKIALNLRKLIIPNENSHDDIIYISSLFHDIGKGIEPHAETGSAMANELLKEYCTQNELRSICEIIAKHNDRDPMNEQNKILELVQDADLLDHSGTMEIWINFLYHAREDMNVNDSLAWYSSGEWDAYINKSKGFLNFKESKMIFNEKISFVNDFIERLKVENDGGFFL